MGSRTNQGNYHVIVVTTASHDINAVYSVQNIRIQSILYHETCPCDTLKFHGYHRVILHKKVGLTVSIDRGCRVQTKGQNFQTCSNSLKINFSLPYLASA